LLLKSYDFVTFTLSCKLASFYYYFSYDKGHVTVFRPINVAACCWLYDTLFSHAAHQLHLSFCVKHSTNDNVTHSTVTSFRGTWICTNGWYTITEWSISC